MAKIVVSALGVAVDKKCYSFETIKLFNRLDMEIKVDVLSLVVEKEPVIVVRANEDYHRTTVSKNIEQIAFQLRQIFSQDQGSFSLVEYADRHHRREDYEEWWQWRFNWVGKTPLDGQRYLLSSSKIELIKSALLHRTAELSYAS